MSEQPEERQSPKIGAGHVAAMGRQGLRELRGALYPDSNVAQPPEYGLYGTMTPGEIAEDRKTTEPQIGPDEERSVLGERLQQAEVRLAERERSDREPTLER